MSVYLVRHAKAGSRRDFTGDDDLRPLSKPGRRQADAVVDALATFGIVQIVSSPFLRCRQSVEPLAARLRLPVDLSDALAEGAGLTGALRLVEKVADRPTVVCSHGDVIGNLLSHFARQGVHLDENRIEKCSIWALDTEHGAVIAARYLPPPE